MNHYHHHHHNPKHLYVWFTLGVAYLLVLLSLSSNHTWIRTDEIMTSSVVVTSKPVRIPQTTVTTYLILLRWFNGLCHGKYIELGALNGILFSNSYLFEFVFSWTGLLIEITPNSFEELQKNRPNNILVNAGVCEQRQTIHYYGDTDDGSRAAVTGIVEFAADGFRKRWWPNLQNDWSNTKEMDCIPLQDIIQQHYSSSAESSSNHHVHFDFLSLDVEGAEDQVLRSMDYTKVSFGVILLEADKHNERKNLAVRVFLEANGYTYLFHEQRSYWFVHRNFDQIYRHVLHA